jgi:ATP-dependent helicase/nuclease subunit A
MSAAVKPLADAEARRRIAEDLTTTFFVEAAAGTGKTTALVGRIVSLLRSGEGRLDRIVAVTFTEKAAGEMKLRLRGEIERARADAETPPAERVRLEAALEQLELARIATIHAFCSDLLHERPVEAGVDPRFEVASEDEARALLDRAFETWFQRTLAEPPEGVRRVLRRKPIGFGAAGPRQQLRAAVAALVEHRDFDTAWRRVPFDRDTKIDTLLARLAEVAGLAARAKRESDYLARNLAEIQRFVDENAHREAVRGRDHDALEAELRDLARSRRIHWHWKGSPRAPYGKGLERVDVLRLRNEAKRDLDSLIENCDADLAPRLQAELRPVIEEYEAQKARSGRLDFVDLLVKTRDLLVESADVRRETGERFSHFFVDEFQDTDPLQAEIVLLLSSVDTDVTRWQDVTPVPGKLFLVGDPKQSIYRFRRADVAIYEALKRRLTGRGAEVLYLSTSFRALPALQHAVNAAFAPQMTGGDQGIQAEYVPLEPFRPDIEDRPGVVVLPVPRPYGDYGTIVNFRIEDSYPDAVGAYVAWLVNESGWTVREGDADVPVQPRHVCLLFRRFKRFRDDMTRGYVRALEARRVPHVMVGGRSFHDREEVLALRNALCALEWPDDPLRVYATLRGPFFALGDDALLAFKDRHGSLHPLAPHDASGLQAPGVEASDVKAAGGEASEVEAPGYDDSDREVAAALSVLRALHRERNHRPIAETLSRLLQAVRAHAGIAIWPTGEQALANCLRVIDLARRFERRGATSFRAFAERMEDEALRGDVAEAPVVEEGTEGVRIMTVHRAKGLEFPVVILADPTANKVGKMPGRHVDPERRLWAEPLCGCAPPELLDQREAELARDEAEAVRLVYVATTRAKDLLVVPGIGDEARDGWLDVLKPVIYPTFGHHRDSKPAPGCPEFGEDTVLERGNRASRGPGSSVRPGLHAPQTGGHDVVWWDPMRLDLDRQEEVGLRQQRILEADASGAAAKEGERTHAAWRAGRDRSIESGRVPTLAVSAVTDLAHRVSELAPSPSDATTSEPASAREIEIVEVSEDRSGRPSGKRFGLLVHATLAAVDFDAGSESVATCARAQGRLLGAPDSEVSAAAGAVLAALAHPLLRSAAASAASGGVRRETPLLLRLSDGSLAEGVVDLAFRSDTERDGPIWTVVDFKTDRSLGSRQAEYETQVGIYADGIAAATGEPTRGLLLVV